MLSEARVTPGYVLLSWCARALTEEILCLFIGCSLLWPSQSPTQKHYCNSSVGSTYMNVVQSPHLTSLSPVGHLAAVHGSKRSCFQEHQNHRRVLG